MRNKNRLDFVYFDAAMEIKGMKLKQEKYGGMHYTRIYELGEMCSPPYDIVYHLPYIHLSGRFNLDSWDFVNQFTDDFKVMGLSWLPKPEVFLRKVSVLSEAVVECEFVAKNPPVKATEHIT